jgi:ABC-type glycerol-3-phosphate transport system substrate-binding protein
MLAGGDQLDAFIAFNTWTDLAANGYIAPLNDLLETYGQNILATQPETDFAPLTNTKTGEIMAVPFGNTRIGNAPRVRIDWLETLGLKVPTDLASFEAMLKAFKETDKLGETVIPLITSFQFNQLDRAFAGMWIKTGDNNFIDTDGKVKECVFAPGYKDYIAKMAEWYDKGYIWPESFIQEFTVINDIVSQDRVGAMATWVSVGLSGYDTAHTTNDKIKYAYLETLTGPAGSAYSLRPASSQGIVISANSEKKETVMKLWNWLATDNNSLIAANGVEGVHWDWVDKDKRIIEKTEAGKQFKGIDTLFSGYGQNTYDSSFGSSLWKQFADFDGNPDLVLKLGDDNGIVYDQAAIDGTVPSIADLQTYKNGEIVKFIMGQREMSEWADFIKEMLDMGFDKVIEERTTQYNAMK